MKQEVLVEPPHYFARARFPQVPLRFPYPVPDCEAEDIPARLFGKPAKIHRSAERDVLRVPVWLTSLHRPGIFEVLPTENVGKFGVCMVSPKSWEPSERVLVSSPPGFCRSGSVVYCKKLPSEDYVLGIRLNAPVDDWVGALGLLVS